MLEDYDLQQTDFLHENFTQENEFADFHLYLFIVSLEFNIRPKEIFNF